MIHGDHVRGKIVGGHRPGDTHGRSGSDESGAERVARRELDDFPFFAGTDGEALGNRAAGHREYSPGEVDRCFAANIERMSRDQADQARLLRANPYARDRTPGCGPTEIHAAAEAAGRPQPAKHRIKNPSAVMIWQPAPGLVADERRAENRIHEPTAVRERGPSETHTVGSPAIALADDRVPRTVGI